MIVKCVLKNRCCKGNHYPELEIPKKIIEAVYVWSNMKRLLQGSKYQIRIGWTVLLSDSTISKQYVRDYEPILGFRII